MGRWLFARCRGGHRCVIDSGVSHTTICVAHRPYEIGTRIYYWTDLMRAEPFTADPGDRRQLVVQIWYPAHGAGPRQPYMDHRETITALASRFHLPAFLFRNIEHAPTHALTNAPAAEGRFPVLLNPTGLSGFRDASLFWIEELASHGYVVIGLDQPRHGCGHGVSRRPRHPGHGQVGTRSIHAIGGCITSTGPMRRSGRRSSAGWALPDLSIPTAVSPKLTPLPPPSSTAISKGNHRHYWREHHRNGRTRGSRSDCPREDNSRNEAEGEVCW